MIKFASVSVPIISLEREISYAAESIVCDNEAGGKMVAEHLYRQGCRKLLYLNPGHWTGMQSDSRGISFRRQGEQMGMQVKEYCATWEEHKRLDYHKTILEVLEKNPDADGIFCNGDAMALQTIQICTERELIYRDKSGSWVMTTRSWRSFPGLCLPPSTSDPGNGGKGH